MNTELYLTDSCNMRCAFCGSWNQHEVANALDIELVKDYLDSLIRNGYRYLSLSGGEPFLYSHLYEVIEYAHSKGLLINLTTNGLLIDEKYLSFVKSKNVMTRISLHTLNRDKFFKVTGVDLLERVTHSIELFKEMNGTFGIGVTVSDYNIDEIDAMAQYALSNNANYIRFTPVYRVYKGTEYNTNRESFYTLLKSIAEVTLKLFDELETKQGSIMFGEELLDIYTTKSCGAGSDAYVALNPDLKLIACPVLPHYFELPVEKYSSYESIAELKQKYSNLIGSITPDKLEGQCSTCIYRTTCRGGCISIKLEEGLALTAEQPICINRIVHNVLSNFGDKEKKKLIDYWNYWNKKNASNLNAERGCIRRLPIWEIHFQRKTNYRYDYKAQVEG